jgi:hypothetical protein
MKYFSETLTILSIIILILVIYLARTGSEYYSTSDDDELIFEVEDVRMSDAEKSQRQRDYQQMLKEKEMKKQMLTRPCISRCDCCWDGQTPEAVRDRTEACSKNYKLNSLDYNNCIKGGSTKEGRLLASEACKSSYGTGGVFGFGKKC